MFIESLTINFSDGLFVIGLLATELMNIYGSTHTTKLAWTITIGPYWEYLITYFIWRFWLMNLHIVVHKLNIGVE